MKYQYKQIKINGEDRISEMHAHPTVGSNTYLESLIDENGSEIYQLQNGEPVNVGPTALSDDKKREIVKQKLLEQLADKLLDGDITSIADIKTFVDTEYNKL